MATEVLLPKQGNSVESCIIVEWKKQVGDAVSVGDAIVEVETDKATMEVESTAEGVILKLLVDEGDDVPVLDPIAIVGESGETVEESSSDEEPADTAGSAGKEAAPAKESSAAPTETAAPSPASQKSDSGQKAESAGRKSDRIAISPRARKLAGTEGVDYSALEGSGPGGRIMVRDIEAAMTSPTAGQSAAAPSGTAPVPATATESAAEYEEIPVRGVRKVIAERMHNSLISTAQFTMNSGADARQLLGYRAQLKASNRPELNGVSINDLVMFAVSRVLLRYPELNATFSDGVIRRYKAVNLGFAVDTDKGLMVPVIHNAHSLSLTRLAAEAHRLAEACKAMKARPEDLQGATFSVTNLGVYGITSFTPVLDAPQVGILGVGSIEPKPVSTGEDIDFVPTLALSLTIDHQIVDGAPGARFLEEVTGAISSIELTLAQ